MADGDTLDGSPTVGVVAKRGRALADVVDPSPAPAVQDDVAVAFWVEIPADLTRGNYLAIVTCGTTNGETVIEEAPLIVA